MLSIQALTPCDNLAVTLPQVSNQTYTVGEQANLYRFDSFGLAPFPAECGAIYYYYAVYFEEDGQFVPNYMYHMFSVAAHQEEPMIQIGQYYPNNYLMDSYLTLQTFAVVYLQVGSFRSQQLLIYYTFVDPCPLHTQVVLSVPEPLPQYFLYSPPAHVALQTNLTSNYSFCVDPSYS